MPLWVKAVGSFLLVVVLVLVVMLISGRGGSHGPSRHSVPADAR